MLMSGCVSLENIRPHDSVFVQYVPFGHIPTSSRIKLAGARPKEQPPKLAPPPKHRTIHSLSIHVGRLPSLPP